MMHQVKTFEIFRSQVILGALVNRAMTQRSLIQVKLFTNDLWLF